VSAVRLGRSSVTFPAAERDRGTIAVVRLRVAELLKARGMSWYKLAQLSGLSQTQVYRMCHADGDFGRLTRNTLDKLCTALDVQPGDLLEWVPGSRPPRPRSSRRAAR
jgi:putative transcriptional regulator